MNYYEVEFELKPLMPAREVLLVELAERGFESFVETDNGIKAYIQEKEYTDALLVDLAVETMEDQEFSFCKTLIAHTNWNAEWEKNFDPIIVDDKCLIRAPFHSDLGSFPYDIIIEPKMSFGTGHHATTHLVVSAMMNFNFSNKVVLDMGCGTGILAILAQMLGAKQSDAIDIDEWSYENTIENIERNGVSNITTILGGAEVIPAGKQYDVILANINRNILVRDMHFYNDALATGGSIFFSGFYTHDKPEIDQRAISFGWKLVAEQSRNEWCMLHYQKG
jgi:ribosomal protein L11 methyltransferase